MTVVVHPYGIAAIIAAAMLALGGLHGLQRSDHGDSAVQGPVARRIAQIRDRHLPNIEFSDHEGRSVKFYDDLVRDKVVAINFMYAACSKTCALSSQNMASLQDELGDRLGRNVALISISLDPEHDDPAALAAFRAKQGAKTGCTFLSPRNVAEVTELRRKLGVYDPDPAADGDLSNHTGIIVLGNEPAGRWTMIPSLVNPVRIRQALERVMPPPDQWPRGQAVIDAVPREDSERSVRR